jgi:hypothetical protein
MRWVVACVPLCAGWACASGDEPANNARVGSGATGGTGGAGGSTGGSKSGTGGSSAGSGGYSGTSSTGGSGAVASGCTGAPPQGGTDALIDDLEDGNNESRAVDGRKGYWFVFNDATTGGVQTPTGDFTASDGGANGSAKAAHTTGTGFTNWGGGMGVSFNAVGSLNCPYNAISFTGIEFWAKGTGLVRVMVGSDATVPVSAGGTCTPEADCHNHHGKDITFTANWTKYTLAWSDLTQDSTWGKQVGAIDPSKLIQINFQAKAPFDFWVDDLAFTGGSPTTDGGSGGSAGSAGAAGAAGAN